VLPRSLEIQVILLINLELLLVVLVVFLARNTTNTTNNLGVVYDYVILQFYATFIDHIKRNRVASLKNLREMFIIGHSTVPENLLLHVP